MQEAIDKVHEDIHGVIDLIVNDSQSSIRLMKKHYFCDDYKHVFCFLLQIFLTILI